MCAALVDRDADASGIALSAVLGAQRDVLERIVRGDQLSSAIADLILSIEAASESDVAGSVLLLEDGLRLRHCAAPSLPSAYNDAIDGITIGPDVGSCGTAAYTAQPVIVEDIATDPLWVDFCDLALGHGLRARAGRRRSSARRERCWGPSRCTTGSPRLRRKQIGSSST